MAVSAKGDGLVRYAVVGAGWIAQQAFMPAVAHTGNSRLVALVTGDSEKASVLGKRYGLSRVCGYDDYDDLVESGEIDAVYIALPNPMHRDYTLRALESGVHVLCEKPMAPSEEDCQAMIAAARANRCKLMIAYRLHFEPATLAALETVRSGRLGEVRLFSSAYAQHVEPRNHRARFDAWAGPIPDMGPYPINMARQVFQAEPEEVLAMAVGGERDGFTDGVPEMVAVLMRFPGGRLAQFTCSFGADPVDEYRILGTQGSLHAEPGFGFLYGLGFSTTIGGKTTRHNFPFTDQFGGETQYFSDCILHDRAIEPDGEEGLADVRVLRAIQESFRSKQPQAVPPLKRALRPQPNQATKLPPVLSTDLIQAAPPPG